MRKLMFCLVASTLLMVGGNAFAQDDAEMEPSGNSADSAMQVGVVGIVNFSSQATTGDDVPDDFENPDSKMGFGGGARLIYNFTDMFGIQPELLFNQRGASEEVGEAEFAVTMNYLHVPLLARIQMPMDGGITPKFLVGPSIGYYLSGSATVDGEDAGDAFNDDDVAALEIGVDVGAGLDYDLGGGSLSLDLRYHRGFTNISDADTGDLDVSTVNTGFDVLLGYNFKL
jgi:hypothetical protein